MYGVFNEVGVSDLKFMGSNATMLVLTNNNITGSWFSLNNSTSVSFCGLTLITHSSLSLISLINVSSVEMTNMKMEGNVCSNLFTLMKSTGYFQIQNLSILMSSTNGCSCSVHMTQFKDISGLISISGSKYHYKGFQLLPILAIDVKYGKVETVSVIDTEIHMATVSFDYSTDDIGLSSIKNDSVLLLDNVLINSSYISGLRIQTINSVAPSNIIIINTTIERVNGTALFLRLDSYSQLSTVIRNSEFSWNNGQEEHEIALVIIGVQSSHHVEVELDSVTISSNGYFRGDTTMIDTVDVLMTNCSFTNNAGTALFLHYSTLTCFGYSKFIGNLAYEAAGISIGEGSRIEANSSDTVLMFVNNTANDTGGAIFLRIDPASFIRLINHNMYAWCFVPEHPPLFYFQNNIAKDGGDNIFGVNFEFKSSSYLHHQYYCIDVIQNMSTFASKSVSSIASLPMRVCLCGDDGRPRCLEYERNMSIYPGQTVHIQAVTVGEQFGTSRGSVYAQILNKSSSTTIPTEYKVQTVGIRNCTNSTNTLTYKLATAVSETIVLRADNFVVSEFVDKTEIDACIAEYRRNLENTSVVVPRKLVTLSVFVTLNTLACPLGFSLHKSGCECATILQNNVGRYKVSCSIDTHTISREYSVWVDATNTSVSYSSKCSLLYCNPILLQVNLSRPDGSDVQCLHHRSGVLCGGCQKNYSLAIGSSNCLPNCSNQYLFLLAVFAVAGVMLVLFIKYLNLTITQGFISGLIVYANIVQTNKAVLLSFNDLGVRVFATVIAWFNLDFGIETCFLKSMDMFTKTCLQFAFPLYLWILAGGIILACRCSQLVTRFFGNNAVHVLATIFLLSYNKLLRIITTVYSATTIQVESEHIIREEFVWAYDGNLPYLGRQHAILFAISTAVFLILWLPFTVLILLGPWLQRYNHLRGLRWLGKLQPLFDAYYGPLKDRRHYWVGILLLARVCVIFPAADPLASDEGSLLTIICVVTLLLLLLLLFGKVYRKYYISVFEVTSYVNILFFAVLSFYFVSAGGKQEIAVYISGAIFMFCFIFVLIIQCFALLKQKSICGNRKDAYATVTIKGDDELPDLVIDDRSQC